MRSVRRALGIQGVLAFLVGTAWADPATSISDCRRIEDDVQRLHCYDAMGMTPKESPAGSAADQSGAGAAGAQPALERRLEKGRDLARRAFAIVPHRPNYVLHTCSSDPNVAPFLAVDPNTDIQYQEIMFQISLRVPLYNKMFGDNGDLWFGYTQLSFWQAYNRGAVRAVSRNQL